MADEKEPTVQLDTGDDTEPTTKKPDTGDKGTDKGDAHQVQQDDADDDGNKKPDDDANDDDADTDNDTAKWKSLARKWQKRSESNLSDLEETKAQVKELQAQIDKLTADAERKKALEDVAKETGVPVEILDGYEDVDAARNAAKAIKEWAGHHTYPRDQGGAPQGGGDKVTKASIEAIKSPVERVRARAAHADLYRK